MNKNVIIGLGLIAIAVIIIRKSNQTPAPVTKEKSSACGGCGH